MPYAFELPVAAAGQLLAIEIVYRVLVPHDRDIGTAALELEWVTPGGRRETPAALHHDATAA